MIKTNNKECSDECNKKILHLNKCSRLSMKATLKFSVRKCLTSLNYHKDYALLKYFTWISSQRRYILRMWCIFERVLVLLLLVKSLVVSETVFVNTDSVLQKLKLIMSLKFCQNKRQIKKWLTIQFLKNSHRHNKNGHKEISDCQRQKEVIGSIL